MFPKRKENVLGISKPPVIGIFHRNWFTKHLRQIPAVVILFYELDWNDSHWTEKQLDCGLQLNYLRSGLCNRGTKLALVLIQKNSLPTGEDALAMERAASLTNVCELQSNSLFVLPVLHADHLVGYVIRLQNVFIEQAVQYYLSETKRIKSHKDTLNRPNYQFLQARHLIKVSFFHEIRKDITTALKHYNMTYNQLIDTKVSNQHEMKILCGFINFKICQLSFRAGAPLDAIAQFDRHVKQFKLYVGHSFLEFQHMHWLANQFEFFGDLFNDTVCAGLTALQTKHPGFYYLQAAQFHMERRKLVEAFKDVVIAISKEGELNIKIPETKYFGQFPWEGPPMYGTMINSDISPEDYMRYYQKQELEFDYSRVIIPLLNKAVGHFKQYKPTRMKRFLMIEMGQEYYLAKDYEKAYSIAMCVLHEYRKERWYRLLTHVLELCLKCSYLLGNVRNYIEICCELIGSRMTLSNDYKVLLQRNLLGILGGSTPHLKLTSELDLSENIAQVWSKALRSNQTYSIELSSLVSFLSCKASFTSPSFQIDQHISLKLILKSSAIHDLQISKISLQFDKKEYNDIVVWDNPVELLLKPNQDKVFTFDLSPQSDHTGLVLKIASIKVHLLGANSVILQYSEVNCRVSKNESYLSTRIIPRVSQTTMELAYHSPLLVGENQEIKGDIQNNEPYAITNIRLSVIVKSESNSVAVKKELPHEFTTTLEFMFNKLESGKSTSISFIARCQMVAQFDISYVLSYKIVSENSVYPCEYTKSTRLSSVLPFNVSTYLMSSRCDPIDKLYTCDRCLIYTEISAVAHTSDIEVTELKYDITDTFIYEEDNTMKPLILSPLNQVNNCIAVQPKDTPSSLTKIALGSMRIWWRRSNVAQHVTCTDVKLPQVEVQALPVHLTNQLPSYGVLYSPLCVKLCIINVSKIVQELDVNFDPGDTFMFSGHKHLRYKILPNSKEYLHYRLVPLKSGLLSLPLPTIKLLRYQDINSNLLTSKLTKLIYVRPSLAG